VLRRLVQGAAPGVVAALLAALPPRDAVAAPVAPRSAASRAELSLGAGGLVYLSPYAGWAGGAVTLAVQRRFLDAVEWGVGTRLGFSPARPEYFGRLLAAPRFTHWEPSVGLEVGLSTRDDLARGGKLLSEIRERSLDSVSPIYFAWRATPLRWRVSDRWSLSALELQVGTHIAPMGRVARAEIVALSVGVTL